MRIILLLSCCLTLASAATPMEDLDHLSTLVTGSDPGQAMAWIYGSTAVDEWREKGLLDTMWKETQPNFVKLLARRADLRFAEKRRFRFKSNTEGGWVVPLTIDGVEHRQMFAEKNGHWIPSKIVTLELFEKAVTKGEIVLMD